MLSIPEKPKAEWTHEELWDFYRNRKLLDDPEQEEKEVDEFGEEIK